MALETNDQEVVKLRRFRAKLLASVGHGITPLMALQALHAYLDMLDGKAGRKKLAPPDATMVRPLRGPVFRPHPYISRGRWIVRGPSAR